jgi:hypothetical protein
MARQILILILKKRRRIKISFLVGIAEYEHGDAKLNTAWNGTDRKDKLAGYCVKEHGTLHMAVSTTTLLVSKPAVFSRVFQIGRRNPFL